MGCPDWWSTEHFDILVRAIRVQAAHRHGVFDLALWVLAPPSGGWSQLITAPTAAVAVLVPAPPSVGPASRGSGTVPARGGEPAASAAPTVSVVAPRSAPASMVNIGTSSLGLLEKRAMAKAVA